MIFPSNEFAINQLFLDFSITTKISSYRRLLVFYY